MQQWHGDTKNRRVCIDTRIHTCKDICLHIHIYVYLYVCRYVCACVVCTCLFLFVCNVYLKVYLRTQDLYANSIFVALAPILFKSVSKFVPVSGVADPKESGSRLADSKRHARCLSHESSRRWVLGLYQACPGVPVGKLICSTYRTSSSQNYLQIGNLAHCEPYLAESGHH